MNNLEGMLDGRYLRLHDPDAWDRINAHYESAKYIPGYRIIGSLDGDAICVGEDRAVHIIPFVPMCVECAEPFCGSVEELQRIIESGLRPVEESHPHYGRELHLVMPPALGGSPTDAANRQLVPQDLHARLCRFWNGVYFRLTREARPDPPAENPPGLPEGPGSRGP